MRFLLGKHQQTVRDLMVESNDGLQLVLPNLIENSYFEMFTDGSYEEESLLMLSKLIPPHGIMIDAGANIGLISLAMAKRRPDIQIYAFEASPFIYQYLQNNIANNQLHHVRAFNLALHEKSDISLPFYSPEGKTGCGSFSPVFTHDAIMVPCISLDDFCFRNSVDISKIGCVKIDVEGYEATVLKGAEKIMQKGTPVYFEFVDWAEKLAGFEPGNAQQELLNSGYTLHHIEKSRTIPSAEKIINGGKMILALKAGKN